MKEELDRLMPSLQELSKQEAERKALLAEKDVGAGNSYAEAYEKMSRIECVLFDEAKDFNFLTYWCCRTIKLEDAVRQVVKLAAKLEISSLSSPPV